MMVLQLFALYFIFLLDICFLQSEDDLSFLVRLADPRGGNPSLTLEQYREIMWEWIKQLQQGSRDGQ